MRRKAWDDSGVSEVIGTILILAMTVVLFSAIILWVTGLPTPQPAIRLEIEGIMEPVLNQTGGMIGANVTLTHRGGEALLAHRTELIRVYDDGSTVETQVFRTRGTYLGSPYGLLDGGDDDWNINERWNVRDPVIVDADARVIFSVVDTIRSTVLWQANLQAQTGDHPPLFLEKWVDGDTSTLTIDLPRTDKTFGVYARVWDPDGDLRLHSVEAELTFGSGGTPLGTFRLHDDGTTGDRVPNDGIFSRTFSFKPNLDWDGGIIIFNATDDKEHETVSRLVMQVEAGTSTTVVGGGQGPGDLFFTSEFQAYEIYNATEWDTNQWAGTPTRSFVKGETVVVIVASQYLKNLDLQNDFMLYDPAVLPQDPIVYGNAPYDDPVGPTTRPSSTAAFTLLEFLSDFYVYEYRFSTTSATYEFDGVQLNLGEHSLSIELRANNVPPPRNRFATVDSICITNETGECPDFPKVEFFKDPDHTQPSTEFNFTETLYVKVTFRETDATLVDVSAGDVTISDFIGGVQVWSTPGNPPISALAINDSRSYAFSIDLSNPNRDPWIFGRNSYGFRIKVIEDSNEEYALSSQVVVRGPRWSLDVITALNEFTHPVFDEKWYATFYDNDRLWTRYMVEFFAPFPTQNCPDWGCGDFLAVALGDLDEDGDLDALYGLEVGNVFWYRNPLGNGHAWERFEIDDVGSAVTAVAYGQIDRDSDNDVVAGATNGQIWHYDNDGVWTPTLVASTGSQVNALYVADMDADGDNDLVAALQNGEVRIYTNDGFGVFGTVVTDDYLLATDLAVEGTVTGTVAATQASDNGYQSIEEVLGTGEAVETFFSTADLAPAFGDVISGSHTNTHSDDGTFHILEEEFSEGNAFDPVDDRFLLRNSSAGAAPGYQYYYGDIPALGANDTAEVTVSAFLSVGTEAMQIGYKVGTGGVTVLGTVTETSEATKTFDLSANGFTGGELYIVVQDSDTSTDDGNSDGDETRISIDFIEVRVVRVDGQASRLEHKWQTETIGAGGDAYKIFVEAHHTINDENDDFLIQWSTDVDGPWADLVTITKTADDDAYQSAALPTSVAGQAIYVRVVDTNRTDGGTELDTVHIDHVFIRRFNTVPTFDTISVGTAVQDVAVADINLDDANDVVVAAGNNAVVYFGSAWTTSQSLDAGGSVLQVDVGYIDADGRLDVVTGTDGGEVHWFANDGSWTRTLITDFNSAVNALRVGDVDGDFWDDVVVGLENGNVRWLRHDRGTSWVDTQVAKLDTDIKAIDIGDVDRGVVIDPSTY